MTSKAILLTVSLALLCGGEARAARSLPPSLSSILIPEPEGAPATFSLDLENKDPAFLVTGIKTNFRSMDHKAALLLFDATRISIDFNTVPLKVKHVTAFLNMTSQDGSHHHSIRYLMDTFSSICPLRGHSGLYECAAGRATLGPIAIPSRESLPVWAQEYNQELKFTLSIFADKGKLLLSAPFSVLVVDQSLPGGNDCMESDPFDCYQ